MKKIRLLFSLAMFLVLTIGALGTQENVSAEEVRVPTPEEIEEMEKMYAGAQWGSPDSIEGLTDCSKYYTFQSVQVSVHSEKSIYGPGEPIIFTGYVENENEQPVVNGTVFARISVNNDSIENGHFVVDEIIALEKIALNPKERSDIKFEWNVPNGIASGDYRIDLFFSAGKKFNLGGLPFSNEIIIGYEKFRIESGSADRISFVRDATQVNGQRYNHIGQWPVIEAGGRVAIVQPIENTFGESRDIEVTYDLYHWDSLNKEDFINSKSEKITISADGRSTLEYEIPTMDNSIYYVRITAISGNQKSIVNIRLVSEQERPRLNYPAITKFPINKGDDFALFSCFHNTSAINTQGKVIVILIDRNGGEVGRVEYEGTIPSAMSAVNSDIQAKDDYEYLNLRAEAYNKDGKLVDSYEATYDCLMFNSCKIEAVEGVAQIKGDTRSFLSARNLLLAIFPLTMIAIIALIVIKKRKNDQDIN